MKTICIALVAVFLLCAVVQATVRTQKQRTDPLVVVHLARENSEEMIEHEFVTRSDPESPLFRKHLSVAELRTLVGAKPRSIRTMAAYLKQRGCTNVRLLRTGDALVCVATAGSPMADDIAKQPQKSAAPRTPLSLPQEFAHHVRQTIVVWPKRDAASKPRSNKVGEPGMEQTPATIFKRYSVPTTPPSFAIPAKFSQGVAEYEGEFFQESDMAAFIAKYQFSNFSIPVMGPNVYGGPDQVEGTLDLQYMGAMAKGKIPTWWLAQNTNNNDPGNIDFTTWADSVLALSAPPQVISISWGLGYERYDFDQSVLVSDNDAFRKIGLTGISLFAASGDDGPGNRNGIFNCKSFTPSWPASSPYLTSVGATYANSETEDEMAVSWSGGGFSTVFPRPSYQAAAVNKYFQVAAHSLPNASFYNASGRGYPDVAAVGTNFNVYVQGSWQPISGTSCASPTFAGVVALVLAERISKNEPAFGFLNPKLYSLGKVGFDVTQGASQDMNCFPLIPLSGFPAATGWDAVSGLGTPDYTYLRQNL